MARCVARPDARTPARMSGYSPEDMPGRMPAGADTGGCCFPLGNARPGMDLKRWRGGEGASAGGGRPWIRNGKGAATKPAHGSAGGRTLRQWHGSAPEGAGRVEGDTAGSPDPEVGHGWKAKPLILPESGRFCWPDRRLQPGYWPGEVPAVMPAWPDACPDTCLVDGRKGAPAFRRAGCLGGRHGRGKRLQAAGEGTQAADDAGTARRSRHDCRREAGRSGGVLPAAGRHARIYARILGRNGIWVTEYMPGKVPENRPACVAACPGTGLEAVRGWKPVPKPVRRPVRI